MLSIVAAAATASVPTATLPWHLTSAVSTISALEKTSIGREPPYSLLDVMYDDSTGLCSEGVWHNSWLGVSRVLSSRVLRAAGDSAQADELMTSAFTLGDSLHKMSFDGDGFKRRASSGIWQRADDELSKSFFDAAGEDLAFYLPSDEHRCASSAAACIFFSLLAEESGDDDPFQRQRSIEVFDCMTKEFFDTSTCRFKRDASGETTYWRAVDQAVGCLACLRLAKSGHQVASCRAMASCAADSLLREFGYSLYATEGTPPGTYLGRAAPRNSWHDSLSCLALLAAGVLGVGGESPAGLVRAMVESYRDESGAMLHRPKELRRRDASGSGEEVAFTSTQALWSAVVRAADLKKGLEVDEPALRAWYEKQRQEESNLLPVANVYQDARLWANTEWAAWVLLGREVFAVTE